MDTLLNKRRTIKGQITRLENVKAAPFTQQQPTVAAKMYVEKVEKLSNTLDEIQDDIANTCLVPDELSVHDKEYNELVTRLEELHIHFASIIHQTTSSIAPTSQASPLAGSHTPSPDVKLPNVELPSFGGNFVDWFTFHDLFTAMVHNNKVLSGAQKFQYLKASLKNEAALLIKSIPVTDANYPDAWDILTQRYNDTSEIIDAHIKRLFTQPNVTQESPTALRHLIDTTAESVRALKVLKEPVQHWDAMLLYIVKEKLDPSSRREWELSLSGNIRPTFEDLTTFLDQRARALAAAQTTTASGYKARNVCKPKNLTTIHYGTSHSQCVVCNESHSIYKCQTFLNSPTPERWNLVRNHSLCHNCLRTGHSSANCKAGHCNHCPRRHNTLLHQDKQHEAVKKVEEPTEVVSHMSRQSSTNTQVFLSTAIIQVIDSSGQIQSARALLDSASQASFISERCAQRLQLNQNRLNVYIGGIGASDVGTSHKSVQLEIRSNADKNVNLKVEALILKRLTENLPSFTCDPSQWTHLLGLQLADPKYHTPGQVDILLGADIYLDLIRDGHCKGPPGTPGAFNTVFGWAISGAQGPTTSISNEIKVHHCMIDEQIQKFWAMEELPPRKMLTSAEVKCEDHFVKTHTRDNTGRYTVRLPLSHDPEVLGNSRNQAVRRFITNERRLQSKPDLYDQYRTFMDEYLSLGHMELIPKKNVDDEPDTVVYYLPHHGVTKASSTTKLRVVFDGSAKTTSGISLNDIMLVGPKLQEDLIKLLFRFRFHIIVMTADLEKMYRQILVNREDTDLQRIVWRKSIDEPIQDYRLMTVTYGTASAPYLAVKALQQLALDEKDDFPLAHKVLMEDFYIDDLLSGANTLSEALALQKELIQATQKGGFHLRKWASNEPSLIEGLPVELREIKSPLNIDKDDSIKTLGLFWHPVSDTLSFIVTSPSIRTKVTKRTILSDIAKVFDPLGLLAPVIIRAKLIMQEMWQQKMQWDEDLPNSISRKWHEFREELPDIENIFVHRHISQPNLQEMIIHGYCDASERAYAAVVYLQTITFDGQVKMELITSKTRVAPLKQITTARLELCGAVLLSHLITLILEAWKIDEPVIHCWSDSTTVLAWLASTPSRWKTFVANRVSDIQDTLPSAQWHHIAGNQNPADCASRGLRTSQLRDHSLWWHGPQCTPNEVTPYNETEECLHEEKRDKTLLTAILQVDTTLLGKYSSTTFLIHVTAYILRFLHNVKPHQNSRRTGPLTKVELDLALRHWIRAVQHEHFPNEIKNLRQDKPLSAKSKILSLHPYMDKEDILRVGGRLRHANLPLEQAHPALLPKDSKLTDLLINHEHIKSFHGGCQLVLSNLQRRYWIIGARDTIRSHIRKCSRCVRHRAATVQQLMGDLPSVRVNPARPFLKCGVDYAGPFLLRVVKGRGHKMFKAWIAVFVCFTTRALHFELVTDMSTSAFIAALQRFVARRGRPSDIFSDCGTNFVGANREMKEFIKSITSATSNSQITRWLANESITWHFNPPGAPHFGGIWEAGVKSVKHHLKRVMGQTNLTYEEMQTLLCQIEACLNSRPLTALSTDPNDFNALTPGHFLIGDSLTAIPEEDLTSEKTNRLTRWQVGQKILQHFWKRWQNEYLARLQQRPKWTQTCTNLQVNDLVLLKEEDLPPTKWKLARIIQTHPGPDGCVRVVTVKTSDKTLQRPVVKICPLPIN